LNAAAGTSRRVAPPDAVSGLFPPEVVRRGVDDHLTRLLADSAERVRHGRVAPRMDLQAAEAGLAPFDFHAPSELSQVLAWVVAQMEGGITQVAHPAYFGLFNPAPAFASQCADRIAAFFNPQLASATTSPFPVAAERHVIGAIAGRLNMPRHSLGHFTTGGSEANATALVCALTNAEPAYGEDGVYAFKGQPTIYVSGDAHLAWLKLAHQCGIGRGAVRLVATDGTGRMACTALQSHMAADRADGRVPVLVVSTAGTTGAGMIDCIEANGEVARHYGAWHHVDAAWGGAAVVSDRLRGLLRGAETAHSITIDAHKWLATTMGCGMFITARPAVLSDAFRVVMECMPSNCTEVDPYVTTMQWSRRFLGLRLFVGLATVGWEGYAAHVEQAIRLTALLHDQLAGSGWAVVNRSHLAVTCLRPPPGAPDVRRIAAAIVQSGEAWVSTTEFEGQRVLRVCVTNGQTSAVDIARLARQLAMFS
jgi:glutamate/tyrosine decarboxylase-like PLP-dependent enzyme